MRDRRKLLLAMALLVAAMVARMAGLDGAGLIRLAGGLAFVAGVLAAAAVVFAVPVVLLMKLADAISPPRTSR